MKKNGFIFITLFLLVFGRFFLSSIPVANDLHLAYKDTFVQQFSFPQTWQSSNETYLLWNRPLIILSGLLGVLGLSFSLTMKLFVLFGFLIIGVWGINLLLSELNIKMWGRSIGTILYLLNTYILLVLDGGQISIALAYAWFPISYVAVLRGLIGNLGSKVVAGLSIGVLGFLDVRFIYVLFVLLAVQFFYNLVFNKTKKSLSVIFKWIITAFISGIILLGLHFFWVLPGVLSNSPGLPATYTRVSQTSFLNFTELKHAFTLLQPQWYLNIFGKIPPFRKEFLLIPILAFLAPILKRKDKQIWFWTTIAIVSVFLAKGSNPPLGQVYNWLFIHVPGFSLFRDSTKFFFLVALSYSVLIGFSVDEIVRRIPKLRILFPLLLVGYLLFLIRPVYFGQMTGIFSNPPDQSQYFSVASTLESDKNFGRILWIPSKSSLGFSSPTHPSTDALTIANGRPFATGTVGTYEFLNFIREAPFVGEIMKVAGIRYLAYPYPDIRKVDLKSEDETYYHTFLAQLSSLPWIKGKISDIPIPILETKETKDRFFVTPNTYMAVGSDVLYSELTKIKNFDLSKSVFVWSEESPEIGNLIGKNIFEKIILFERNSLDLAMGFVNKDNFVFPAKSLDFSPSTSSGWWKRETVDFVWMRDFLQQKYGIDETDFDYGGGYAVAEGDKQLTITNLRFTKGNILLARVMRSSSSGKIVFYQGDNQIGEVNTKINNPSKVTIKLTGAGNVPDKFFTYNSADFEWVNIGTLVSDGVLTIKSEGDINIVNSLIVLPGNDLVNFQNQANDLIREGKAVYWDKLSVSQKESLFDVKSVPNVTYKMFAPTHYEVNVSGITKPETLIFSESYDPMWMSNGTGSFKAYSLLNGFRIEKDGIYDIYFTPQKYVVPGLVVSVATLTSCIMFLLWRKLKKSSGV